MVEEAPYANVHGDEDVFRLPRRKWRELLFIGAMVPDGDLFTRDPNRPLPAFRDPNLFPEGAHFRVELEGDWVRVTRVPHRS